MADRAEATATTIYGVTSYDRGGNTGYVVHCLFPTRELAQQWADEGDAAAEGERWFSAGERYSVEGFDFYDSIDAAPSVNTYWHRGACVYPDKSVDDWTVEHHAQFDPPWRVREDEKRYFGGHAQGHCGFHISIFGSDREEVEAAYQETLADALTACTGSCDGVGPFGGCGATDVYKAGFWGETRQREASQ